MGVSLETLKNICQTLHLSRDVLLFGTGGGNDARGVAQMLERLTPGQFAIVESVLVKLLEAFDVGQKQATADHRSHVRPRRGNSAGVFSFQGRGILRGCILIRKGATRPQCRGDSPPDGLAFCG